jgi:hypothetical protein
MMRATIKNALMIETQGGAILASEWTTGRGRFVTKRPIPAYCAELSVGNIDTLKGRSRRTAKALLRKHPRARKMIAVVDRRALNRAAA